MTVTGGTPAHGRKIVELSDFEMGLVEELRARGPELDLNDILRVERKAAIRAGRKTKGMIYEEYMEDLYEKLSSKNPRVQEAWRQANQDALRVKYITPGSVHIDATLSNMSVMYGNDAYIGLELMPMVSVAKESDKYYIYTKNNRLAYPDDEIGDRGEANEVHESRTTDSYVCRPRGLSNFVPQRTLNNQDAPLNEMVDLVEAINEGLAFKEEQRIATIIETGANFDGNTTAIAAASRWDSVGQGDPIAVFQDTINNNLWQGRGPGVLKAVSGVEVYNLLSRHPMILDLFKYNGSSPGLATPSMIAGWFGWDSYLIGKARKDTAQEGATASYSRMWKNDIFAVIRVAQRPTIRNASFGYTLRHQGEKLTQLQFDPMKGHGGGWKAQVTMSEVHKTVAGSTSYLLTTVRG